ncbi:MAG: dTDP-4-dehydrorhamnose reductase [Myxococcota bacterium]
MKVFLTGGAGMLGRSLRASWGGQHELVAPLRRELELLDFEATRAAFRAADPEVVVHAAAFTQVDEAERNPDAAFAGNAEVSANVARVCEELDVPLIAMSTDYVFSGQLNRPHHEWDPVGPPSVYGASKLAAEEAIRSHAPKHTIVRIAWLYGPGGPSLLHTLARLVAKSTGPLPMVDDQLGNPTSCAVVAQALGHLLANPIPGVVHATCEGEATWYGFAQEALRLLGSSAELRPCTTDVFPRPAPRPANSRLDNRRLRLRGHPALPTWQDALRDFVNDHGEELRNFD